VSSENRGFARASAGGSAVTVVNLIEDDIDLWVELVSASANACALRPDGSFDCTGTAAAAVPGDLRFRDLAAGDRAICGVMLEGVECWGESTSPLRGVRRGGEFAQVSVGWGFACALDTDGKVTCFGAEPWELPVTVADGRFVRVSAGGTRGSYQHASVCAIRLDETVVCWRYSLDGVLGDDYAPTGSFAQVAAGHHYDCGTLTDGRASCWDDTGAIEAPEGTFTRVLPGLQQNCGLRTDGSVTCWTTPWGDYDLSQLIALSGDYGGSFVDLSMGGDFVCGVRADGGGVECWGSRGR
jgi:hypothetical protein